MDNEKQASRLLRSLLIRHFSNDLTWHYIENTSIYEVNKELAEEIATWLQQTKDAQ